MGNLVKKGMSALVGVALISAAGLAQAETRFAVQDATGTADKMVVTDKGYVGVGTNAPTTAIQAKGSSFADTQIISHYTGTDPTGSGGFLAYRNGLNGATPVLPKKGERIGYMLFGSMHSDGFARNGAGVVGFADEDWTSTSIPAYFTFEVAPPNGGAWSRAERMRITSTGNVGIGTKAPSQRLEVNGGLRLNTAIVKPTTCTSAQRGTVWLTQGGAGVADMLEVCVKDANGNYLWTKLN